MSNAWPNRTTILTMGLLAVCLGGPARADAPAAVSYQGVLSLADGTFVPDGNYEIQFQIFSAPINEVQGPVKTQPAGGLLTFSCKDVIRRPPAR